MQCSRQPGPCYFPTIYKTQPIADFAEDKRDEDKRDAHKNIASHYQIDLIEVEHATPSPHRRSGCAAPCHRKRYRTQENIRGRYRSA
jgi:hypothetical protein